MGKYDMSFEPPIAKGEHVFAILKVEERQGKKEGSGINLFVQLAVAEGPDEGRQIVKTFSPLKNDGTPNRIAMNLIRSFFVAVGLHPEGIQGEIEVTQEHLDGLTGLMVIGKGTIREFNGQEQWEPSSFAMHQTVKDGLTQATEAPPPEPPAEATPPAPTPSPAKTTTAAKPAPAKPTVPAKAATPAAKGAAPRRSI